MELKFTVFLSLFLAVLANGDLLGRIKNLWYRTHSKSGESTGKDGGSDGGGGDSSVSAGRSFSARGGYYDDPYIMTARGGWGGWGGGGGWGDDHQNLDLYSLLGGLSFASLLGATIIYLARRNTSGRRRRSADGFSYLDDDEMDLSEDPQTKGLNIVELIDTFLDNDAVFSISENETAARRNGSSAADTSSSRSTSNKSSFQIHLGPGVVPHKLSESPSLGPGGSH